MLSCSITKLFDACDYREADWRTEVSGHILADPPRPAVTVWPLQRLCGRVRERCVCPLKQTFILLSSAWGRFHTVHLDDLVLIFLDVVDTKLYVAGYLVLNLLLVPLLPSRPSDCRRLPAWLLPHLCTVCRSGGGQRLLLVLLGSHLRSLRPGWFQPVVWRLHAA